MSAASTLKKTTPYVLGAAAVASGVYIWQKTRIGLPEGAKPISNFNAARYTGAWYEIARFDYRFEKGLKNVVAQYSLNDNGTIKVINRGQDIKSGKWLQSTGKAKFVADEHEGRLKVSFFGPFYAAYTVIAIDEDYQHALVIGNDLDYLWLLSRAPDIPDEVRNDYLQKAAAIGYDISRLIWTTQDEKEQLPIATVS